MENLETRISYKFVCPLMFIGFFFFLWSVAAAQISKGGKEMGMKEIREPAVAGAFYPDKPEILQRDL